MTAADTLESALTQHTGRCASPATCWGCVLTAEIRRLRRGRYGNDRDDPNQDGKIDASVKASAHFAVTLWLEDVEREHPDLEMGEQATLEFRAGYTGGYAALTVKRSMEKDL